jgi:hypothetical protein
MKTTLFKALRTYLAVTVILVINIAIAIGGLTFWLNPWERHGTPGPDFPLGHGIEGFKPAKGGSALVDENLSRLSSLSRDGLDVDLRALLQLCGEPDGYMGDISSELNLTYFYDRFGKKDWVAYVTLKHGMLARVGWNDASVNDHSEYKKWDIPAKDIPIYK